MQRNLTALVVEARDLRDTESFGKIDPYVKLTLGGPEAPDGPCQVMRTKTLQNGGKIVILSRFACCPSR